MNSEMLSESWRPHLQTIRSSIDSRTALIWTLIDVGQLLSDSKNRCISLELNDACVFKDMSGLICVIMYPLGLNLFFQPGLGPGFFLILGSSGTFGLLLLLLGVGPVRALAEGEIEELMCGPPLLFENDQQPLLKNN